MLRNSIHSASLRGVIIFVTSSSIALTLHFDCFGSLFSSDIAAKATPIEQLSCEQALHLLSNKIASFTFTLSNEQYI